MFPAPEDVARAFVGPHYRYLRNILAAGAISLTAQPPGRMDWCPLRHSRAGGSMRRGELHAFAAACNDWNSHDAPAPDAGTTTSHPTTQAHSP